MRTLYSPRLIPYVGTNLRSGWIEETFGLEGAAAVAWRGPCHVPTADLVDLEDVAAGAEIHAALMLHFLAEHPGDDLLLTVARQRLLVAEALELLRTPVPALRRTGDDLYLGERKLSVSIATASPSAGLIHLGINIDPTGAPVAAIGLAELGVDPEAFAEQLLATYREEMLGLEHAAGKVRRVE
ncbi:MAG TPA: DUF366 family protein [Armatimonadota bacterium]|jgi:hypothetical protein